MLPARGLALSVTASVVFAALGGYSAWLAPLSGEQVFAWRIVWTIPAMLLLLTLLRHWPRFGQTLARLKSEPLLWLALLANAVLLGIQQWLFMWAPLEGRLLEVTLGYFLLPLVMVVIGRVFYGERLVPLQWLAVGIAALGVLHEFWRHQAFSWVTLLTALGYPPYLMIRRAVKLEPVGGFLLEILFILPWAIWALANGGIVQQFAHRPGLWLLLPGLGILTAIAFASYLASSRLLPLGVLGILGYLEPALLFVLSIGLLGEAFHSTDLGTYGPIWIAVLLTCWHSALTVHRQRNTNQSIAT
ncbi:EamA family transporter RarD [Chitinilyticum piscinae]|uniref:EamA family transporter RarD n=1 Tax=Chitinilyticum piscinae TaxID=2866724 RepID=A0A8J7FPT2_9NEIS|nr:EamA family transporter RarD [Chitinilyticum piscinae]MBE9608376.1 EamA family transporter RarD [Chitinilyticum piscinae]